MTRQTAAAGGKRALPPRSRPRQGQTGGGPRRGGGKKGPPITALLAVLLTLAGLGLILYPTLSDWYYNWTAQREIRAYNEYGNVDSEALFAQAEAYNRELAQKENQFHVTQEEESYVATLLNPLGNGMMGYVEIPKIDVRLPIYQGTDEQALQAGAGWWMGTSLPTGGAGTHCVLTAHTGLVKAKMFTDLDQLVEGDTFTLKILDRVLTYEVDQILITEPSEREALRIVEGEDYVTRYTCTPYGVNTHRLLVRGHRIETPVEEPSAVIAWQTALPLIVGAAGAAAAAGLAVWALRTWRRPGKRVAPKGRTTRNRGDS